MTQSTQSPHPRFAPPPPAALKMMDGEPVAATLRAHPDRLELISLVTVASALLAFVVLVAAVVIPRPVVAPLIGIALAGVFGARLLSTASLRPSELPGR